MSKRKIGEENRTFNKQWEIEYFCCEINEKIVCVICNSLISSAKVYNIKRHYEKHEKTFSKYEGKIREDKFKSLTLSLRNQQQFFNKINDQKETFVKASYIISEMIAKKSKPFVEGEFIKECMLKTSEIICPNNTKDFQKISLSRNTIADRIVDLSSSLIEVLTAKSQEFNFFSIAIDESCDIRNVSQLAIFIRGIDNNLKVTEEFLDLVPMEGFTTAEDIVECIMATFAKYNLSLEKFLSITTDGAPVMIGKRNGVVTLLQNKKGSHSILKSFHCIIHQEVLCTNIIKMDHVLKTVAHIVNFIRSRALNTRLFSRLLDELGYHYQTLPYYTKVRWLSCQKVLKRFVELKEEIVLFLEMKQEDVSAIKTEDWHMDLLFLTDITEHLAELNLKLQGKNQIITDMYDHIRCFHLKLILFETQLTENITTHFVELKKYQDKHQNINVKKYAKYISELTTEFQDRFLDFQSSAEDFELFMAPFSYNVTKADPNLQMELIELQCSTVLKQKYNEIGIPEFYNILPENFTNLKTFVSKILTHFGSTYLCEQLFSIMNNNKNEKRTSLTNNNLVSILKVSTAQNIKPDIDNLVSKKRIQASSSRIN